MKFDQFNLIASRAKISIEVLYLKSEVVTAG